ncbi:hypothetical protein OE749_08655 [Aestuariibacter sp. AA17]|uniref:Ricin B lectin domain-containing protein n=1 Tax=Fluctibacter corallii TaxID=2984329 RepID=A0ABT3A821_9ALTE|nr:hypothetical protein [Aestuariibacter sp. AA17]MCV2884765.1 hypothetical protein [Aestuariibacter sp. AA17]
MKLMLFIAMAILSAGSVAGQVNHLDINGNVVTFTTTTGKSHTLPSCATDADKQKWAISLDDAKGRAMYSLLITSLTSSLTVNVESANACVEGQGIERAGRIWTSPNMGGQASVATKEILKTVGYAYFALQGGQPSCQIKASSKDDSGNDYIASAGGFCSCKSGARDVYEKYGDGSVDGLFKCVLAVKVPVVS